MSGVRGPTSALTEFLRERGITARNTNRFRRRDAEHAEQDAAQQQQQQHEEQGNAQPAQPSARPRPPSVSPALQRSASGSASPATTVRRRAAAGASMRFDEDEESDDFDDDDKVGDSYVPAEDEEAAAGPSSSSRREKRGASTSTPARATSSLAKKPKMGDDEEADYQAPALEVGLAEASGSRSNFSYASRAPVSIAYCGTCKAKFTVTRYTRNAQAGPLCHRCGPLYKGETSTSGTAADDAFRPPAPKKKKQARRKNQNIFDAGHRTMPSLQGFCINIISNYIEDLEALGNIGSKNLDAISRSISKNRSLNPRTLQLFLLPHITSLSLYDCSKLDSESLQTIPTFAPSLRHINLQLCGQLDNSAIDVWAAKLPHLRELELYGSYLVRKEAWHRFFRILGERLVSFKIRESPRFDLGCAQEMVQHCPNITELGLAQIGPLDDAMLKPLETYKSLTYLDVSDPGVSAPGIPPKSLEDAGVITLLKAVGANLTFLDISKNADLTDKTILAGIASSCKCLQTLRLVGLEKVTSEAMIELFKSIPRDTDEEGQVAGIRRLYLDRMLQIGDEVLPALIEHSGADLVELSLNSVDKLTGGGLRLLAKSCPRLERLDLGFCRSVDDAVLEEICAGCKNLQVVYVFGCNRVSDFAKSDRVRIVGKERYVF